MTYLSLAGHRHRATIIARRLNGTVDIEVDAGSQTPVTLTRIELVTTQELRPGTCTEEK